VRRAAPPAGVDAQWRYLLPCGALALAVASLFGQGKSPQERLKEYNRSIKKSVREVERERGVLERQVTMRLEPSTALYPKPHWPAPPCHLCRARSSPDPPRQEKKLMADIKKEAKEGRVDSAKIMAKDLVVIPEGFNPPAFPPAVRARHLQLQPERLGARIPAAPAHARVHQEDVQDEVVRAV
jgi:hypothetical protein